MRSLRAGLPALTIRNCFAGFYALRAGVEVCDPALVEHRTITTFRLHFEARFIVKTAVCSGIDAVGLDGNGNLYGETLGFGQATTGAVFKLTPGGTETVLHWFGGHKDAKFPNPGLVMDAGGNIYGTTRGGGGYKGGTVFQLNPAGVETILYSFGQKKTLQYGMVPEGGLLMDASGKLYGTNSAQGPYGAGYGTVFELTPGGTPNVLYTFQGQPDGSRPMGSLVMDAKGTLYGTTSYGGMYGAGTVFKVNSAGEQILYSFTGGADGGNPMDGLVMDEKGNLYGTTLRGGNTQCPLYSGGCGVVFKIVP